MREMTKAEKHVLISELADHLSGIWPVMSDGFQVEVAIEALDFIETNVMLGMH